MAKKPPARKAAKKRVVCPPLGTPIKQMKTAGARPPLGTQEKMIGAAERPPFGTQMRKIRPPFGAQERMIGAAERPPFGTQIDTIGAAQYPGAPMPNPPWPDPTRPPRPPFGTSVATGGKGAATTTGARSRPRNEKI